MTQESMPSILFGSATLETLASIVIRRIEAARAGLSRCVEGDRIARELGFRTKFSN